MATIIRDINGNRTEHKLGHYTRHSAHSGHWHTDSTGLFIVDYYDNKDRNFAAFIRPETDAERNATHIAKRLGTPRP